MTAQRGATGPLSRLSGAGSLRTLLALCAGAATVFGFAPFDVAVVPIVTQALLFLLWQDSGTPRAAAWTGFAFGFALFGVGVSWISIALSTFGGMPWPAALLAMAFLCAFLALYPAAAGWLATRWTAPRSWQRALAAAAAWTLTEWIRSVALTGYGWLSLGYSQLPDGGVGPLAPYATIGGVFAVSLAVALCAGALALAIDAFATSAPRRGSALVAGIVILAAGGAGLGRVEWTAPSGAPVAVSLLQGNVLQHLKFDPDFRTATFDLYAELAAQSRGRLIVMPESAFPMFADEVPDEVLLGLLKTAAAREGDILIGLFTLEPPLPGMRHARYYNTVVTLGTALPQLYRKRHLVPFGEIIPFEAWLAPILDSILAIPLASQTAGEANPPPLAVAGEKVAVNICYEDTFGADIRPQARAATLLVNLTNDAWYGHSIGAPQHNQIAAMRALETGRPLLRATNTGITSAFDHRGREIAQLPWFTRGILEVTIAGRQGETPSVRFGDSPVVLLAALMLAIAAWRGRNRGR
jgi:apolipoprotein N-acyltransferase